MGNAFSQALSAFLTDRSKRWVQIVALALVFGGAVFLTAQNYRAIDHDLTQATLSRRQSVASLAAGTLTEKFDRLIDLGVSLATRVRFRALVEEGKWSEAVEILRDVPRDFPSVERVFLTDVTGTLMADAPALPGVRGRNFADRDWYAGVRSRWKPYVSNVYTRAAEPRLNVVAVATPIVGRAGGIAGILVLQVPLGAFFDWLSAIGLEENGQIYVVDRNGTAALNGDAKSPGELKSLFSVPAVQRALGGARGVEVLFDPAVGEERLAAYSPVHKYGWGVVFQQPATVAFGPRDRLLDSVLIAYGWTLVLLAGVVYLGTRVIAEHRLGEAMRKANVRLEERVAERTAELAASNRELESFSYSVSHDLRAPLRAIDGFSRILQEDHADKLDAEATRLLNVIRDSTGRMARLIDDLLAFSSLGRTAMKMSSIDMQALAREVVEELRAGSESGAARIVIEPLPQAYGDPALIRQVWLNLLSNALKFSSKKASPEIVVGGALEENSTMYFVRDNGAGFNMDYYHKLFGVFQRLHSAKDFTGTGVGLAIVQRVVSRHGGRVWGEGHEGAGATFYFSLPGKDRGN